MRRAIVFLLMIVTVWTQQRASHCATASGPDDTAVSTASAHAHHGVAAAPGSADRHAGDRGQDRQDDDVDCRLMMRCGVAAPTAVISAIEASSDNRRIAFDAAPSMPAAPRLTGDPPPPRIPV